MEYMRYWEEKEEGKTGRTCWKSGRKLCCFCCLYLGVGIQHAHNDTLHAERCHCARALDPVHTFALLSFYPFAIFTEVRVLDVKNLWPRTTRTYSLRWRRISPSVPFKPATAWNTFFSSSSVVRRIVHSSNISRTEVRARIPEFFKQFCPCRLELQFLWNIGSPSVSKMRSELFQLILRDSLFPISFLCVLQQHLTLFFA